MILSTIDYLFLSLFTYFHCVQVLRASKYYPEAAGLSKLRGLHRCYLLIMVEDLKDFKKAISYLKSLPPQQVRVFLLDIVLLFGLCFFQSVSCRHPLDIHVAGL